MSSISTSSFITPVRVLGRVSAGIVESAGKMAVFFVQAISVFLFRSFSFCKILHYIYEIGVRTCPLIVMVSFFTGMVLALQSYHTLVQFGSVSLIGSLVALTLVLEIGPVLAAVMVVGQAGSALSAEIGIQRNSEQIDALHIMGVSPLAFLIAPRILAGLVCFPLLTAIFNTVGIWGGYVSAVNILGVDSGIYLGNVRDGVTVDNLVDSHIKAAVFGVITILVCCFEGYFTHERASLRGARGVSQSATRAVVLSSVLILLSDYILTSFLI